MGSSFGEVLTEFKRAEAPENIFPLLQDVELCNALVAWKSVRISYLSSAECPHDEEKARWDWLWDNVDFDNVSYGIVAGCKAQNASMLVERLKGLRLIYPDGSISNFAKTYLSQLILQKAKGKGGRKEQGKQTEQ
jgi:hypothetical protein